MIWQKELEIQRQKKKDDLSRLYSGSKIKLSIILKFSEDSEKYLDVCNAVKKVYEWRETEKQKLHYYLYNCYDPDDEKFPRDSHYLIYDFCEWYVRKHNYKINPYDLQHYGCEIVRSLARKNISSVRSEGSFDLIYEKAKEVHDLDGIDWDLEEIF